MTYDKYILVTGGAGFIGSNLVKFLVNKYPNYLIINIDSLTYAGNLNNLKDIEAHNNYKFIKVDIRDFEAIMSIFRDYNIDIVLNLAAESHVDRSITNPFAFAETNVMGTLNLLESSRRAWQNNIDNKLFYHISTDEVYGALPINDNLFTESTSYNPRSPYSASKASSDHFVRAYYHTYGLPIVISNCSNNYGPYQFPEKFIPLIINNIRIHKDIPVYGKGENIRDWLYVEDHIGAIDLIMNSSKIGQTYNIGGNNEWRNIDIVYKIINIADDILGNKKGHSLELVKFVKDRQGHDLRYAIDSSKLKTELGWQPKVSFDIGIRNTIHWYLQNQDWLDKVTDGSYQEYYNSMYK